MPCSATTCKASEPIGPVEDLEKQMSMAEKTLSKANSGTQRLMNTAAVDFGTPGDKALMKLDLNH